MTDEYLALLVERLRVWNVEFVPGLSDREVEQVQATYGVQFPPDLRWFLQYALPMLRCDVPPTAFQRHGGWLSYGMSSGLLPPD